jgi:hypothetical protein
MSDADSTCRVLFRAAGHAEIAASVTDPDMTTVNFPEGIFGRRAIG